MAGFKVFSEGSIEGISKLLGDCGSGSDISRVLKDRSIEDTSGESTKWRRLYARPHKAPKAAELVKINASLHI